MNLWGLTLMDRMVGVKFSFSSRCLFNVRLCTLYNEVLVDEDWLSWLDGDFKNQHGGKGYVLPPSLPHLTSVLTAKAALSYSFTIRSTLYHSCVLVGFFKYQSGFELLGYWWWSFSRCITCLTFSSFMMQVDVSFSHVFSRFLLWTD